METTENIHIKSKEFGLFLSACHFKMRVGKAKSTGFIKTGGVSMSKCIMIPVTSGKQLSENLLKEWIPYERGFQTVDTLTHDDSFKSVYTFCNTDHRAGAGMKQVFENPQTGTYVAGGWSKAANVIRDDGTEICSYSLAVRLTGQDKKITWYQTTYTTGTHDWEYREFSFVLENPVLCMEFFCMLRDPFTGEVWFDDVFLKRSGDTVPTFTGLPVEIIRAQPEEPQTTVLKTSDGLEIGLGESVVTAVRIDSEEVTSNAWSGFLVRDIAHEEHTGVYAFTPDQNSTAKDFIGTQEELGLSLTANYSEHSTHIAVDGVIRDILSREDGRCVQLSFALPVSAAGWNWGANIQCERPIRTGTNADIYRDLGSPIGHHCIKPGTEEMWLSVWDWDSEPRTLSPVSSIACESAGLALSASMEFPQYYILEYNGSTGQYVITFLLGIVPQAPDAARFSFVIYKSDAPAWGFRAAMEKYTRIYPGAYQVREKDQGLWMPHVDIEAVEGFEDFNFKFKQECAYYTRPHGKFEKEHNIRGLQYVEPGDWWCRNMTVERTEENIQQWIDQLAAKEDSETTRQAIANKICQNHDQDGKLSWFPTDAPWSRNGAQVHINASPDLPGKYNFYTVYFGEPQWKKLFDPDEEGAVPFDGIYLDELSGWWRGNANFNTEHYRYTTVPLTYSPYYKKTMLHRASTTWQLAKKLTDILHQDGRMVFANKCPDKDNFFTPLVDGMGTEMTALTGTEYDPQSIDQLSLWRTFSYKKPYSILMSNDYTVFDHHLVELYFQRCLAFGIFPSLFGDYSDQTAYFSGPKKVYNRDRDIWQKYMPPLKTIAEAGWEPVTLAHADTAGVLVERFGSNAQTGIYFTVYNNTDASVTTRISLSMPTSENTDFWELTERVPLTVENNIMTLDLKPGQTVVLATKPLE